MSGSTRTVRLDQNCPARPELSDATVRFEHFSQLFFSVLRIELFWGSLVVYTPLYTPRSTPAGAVHTSCYPVHAVRHEKSALLPPRA